MHPPWVRGTGFIVTVVLSVAAGTVLGILISRSFLQRPQPSTPFALSTSQSAPATIEAAAVPERIQQLAKQGQGPQAMQHAYSFVQGLSPAAIPAVIPHLGALNAAVRQHVVPPLFTRWAREDPVAALAAVSQLAPFDQPTAQNAALEGWSGRDPKALIAWAEQNTNSSIRLSAFSYGVKELANKDPAAALEIALKVEPRHRANLWPSVFRLWLSRDPQGALKAMVHVPIDHDLQQFYIAALMQWLQQDAPAAIAWLKSQPDDVNRRTAINRVAHLLGGADPASAYSLIQTLPANDRQTAVGSFVAAWVRHDSKAAVTWARALPGGPDKEAALTRVIENIADVDPKVGAEMITQDPSSRAARQAARSFAVRYAKIAPDAAFDWATKLPAGETRDEALDSILRAMAEQSPAKAAAGATNLLTGFKRDNVLREALRAWVASDAPAAAAFTAGLPVGRERNELLATVVRPWVEQNPQAAMEWVLTLESGAARRDADKLVAEGLARTDPQAAARFVDKLPASESKESLLGTVLDFWMPKDFDAAAAWVAGLKDESWRDLGYERLANNMNMRDPARAAQYAEKTTSDRRNYARSAVAGRWAEIDPAAAAAWAMRLGTNRRDSPLAMVISSWAKKSPAEASAFVETLPPEHRRNVGYGLISAWAERDPRNGAKWIVERSPEDMRESLTRGIAGEWARRDANAATAWVRELQPGKLRDIAASSLASSLADDTAKLAAEMAELISDPSQRNNAIESVARQWLRHAPNDARAWLATNSLPAPRKERLLKNP